METQEIRKYPVGMQTFEDVINDKYICRQDKIHSFFFKKWFQVFVSESPTAIRQISFCLNS